MNNIGQLFQNESVLTQIFMFFELGENENYNVDLFCGFSFTSSNSLIEGYLLSPIYSHSIILR
jgi:hypothetical protein